MKYSWEGHYCENLAWESDPEGLCILHSLVSEKDKAAFDQALQAKLAQEDFNFREVYFPGPVSFARQKFKKSADFHGVKFSGWGDFREAEFLEGADFSSSRFAQAALFEKARFAGQVLFKGVEIAGEADFRSTTFDGPAIFQNLNERRESSGHLPLIAYFQYLTFGSEGHIRFQDLSLGLVSFLGTDMRRLEFHNVRWYIFRGRQVIYDEILLRGKGGPYVLSFNPLREHGLSYEGLCARVEELYRYLKLNYEQEGDQKQAGDFHYGEMEMHRRASPWRRWFPLSWYNLYWALSGYGERPFRAFLCLLALLNGMALLLTALGLKNPQGDDVGFGNALIFLLQQTTLIHPDWASPASPGGQLLSALSRLLIPAQAALFILALHNRLGRRR